MRFAPLGGGRLGIDRLDDDDARPAAADTPVSGEADASVAPDAPQLPGEQDRLTAYRDLRASADAAYRAHAIDQGCERVRETEETIVTPAMRRIESEDPDRHLVGLENRLKGEDRLTEKVINWMKANPELTHEQAFNLVKDAIRYTFQYTDDRYADGVRADTERLKGAGFELVDCKNSWDAEEYKGINSRWRVPENGQLFELQFHTQGSFEAKQFTHSAYEWIRDPSTPHSELRVLRDFQREVCAKIPIPPGATDIQDYP